MRHIRTMTGRRARWTMFLVVLGLVFGLTPAAQAVGRGPSTLAMKVCASAPEPAAPGTGLSGKIFPKPESATVGDPFASGSTVAIADVYGYSYKWQDYDNGCMPSEGTHANTDISNFMFGWAASVNALTHQEFTFVISPDWLAPFDEALKSATISVQRGFFGPWFTPVLLLVAAAILWAAMRADISSAITSVGWAMLVLVATTYVMSYPTASAHMVDGLVQDTVTTAARGTMTPPVPLAPDKVIPEDDGPFTVPEAVSEAQRALDAQMDTINRATLYSAWLEGALGSSTSATATTYGPALFKASHLSWAEYDTVQSDPVAGRAIIKAKKDAWVKTAGKVESVDPSAYQYLTGNNGRFEAAFIVWLNVGLTMPFLMFAGVMVVVSFCAIRGLIPLVPALGVFGMFRPLQGWLMGILGRVGKLVAAGPIFWAGGLVNFMIVTAVFGTDFAYVLKLTLAAMLPIILFSILKPRKNGGVGKLWRQARGAVLRATKKTSNGGGDGTGGKGGHGGRGRSGRSDGDQDTFTGHDDDATSDEPVFIPTRADDHDPDPEPTPSPSRPARGPTVSGGRRRSASPGPRERDTHRPTLDRDGDRDVEVSPSGGRRSHEPVTPDPGEYRPRRPGGGPSPTSVDHLDLSAPATGYHPAPQADDDVVIVDDDGQDRFVPWTPPDYIPENLTREKV